MLENDTGEYLCFLRWRFASGTREEIHILYVEKLIESHFAIVSLDDRMEPWGIMFSMYILPRFLLMIRSIVLAINKIYFALVSA